MRERQYKKHENMTNLLTSIEEGFVVYSANDEKIQYANPEVIKMYGCNDFEEFMDLVSGTFKGMVHPDDYNRIQWEINDQVNESEKRMDYIAYRIIRKDGSICWIDDCGHLVKSGVSDEDKLFYVLLSDITDKISDKKKKELIELSEKMSK